MDDATNKKVNKSKSYMNKNFNIFSKYFIISYVSLNITDRKSGKKLMLMNSLQDFQLVTKSNLVREAQYYLLD